MPVQVTDFKLFWEKSAPMSLKRNSLIFFSKEVIDLVNKVNSRLLYQDLLSKKQGSSSDSNAASSSSQDYMLLNALEMLWNIENTAAATGGIKYNESEVAGKKCALSSPSVKSNNT